MDVCRASAHRPTAPSVSRRNRSLLGDTNRGKRKRNGAAATSLPPTLETYLERARVNLDTQRKRLPDLTHELSEMRETLEHLRRSNCPVKRKVWDLERQIKKMEKHIFSLRDGTSVRHLQDTAKPYLDRDNQQRMFSAMQKAIPKRKAYNSRKTLMDYVHADSDQHLIYQEFLQRIENVPPTIQIKNRDECPHCDVGLILVAKSANLVCIVCGYSIPFLDATSNAMSYGDEIEFPTFSYKRINHFNEWINLFQAKEATEISGEVYRKVMNKLYENGHRSTGTITRKVIMDTLNELELRKHYNHKQMILSRLTGDPPPRMSPEQEEQCRLMFMATQAPFEKWKAILAPDRKNYLSYSYLLYKFCELRGWNNFLPYFALLKGQDKLGKQDQIFKKICEDLNWEFRASM